MEYNKKQILELYENEKNKTYVAQAYCELNDLTYSDSVRRAVSKIINSNIDHDLENKTTTASNNYSNDKEKSQKGFTAIGEDGQLMSIEKYCEFYGLDVNKIRSYKLISHSGIPFYNIVFFTAEEEVVIDIDKHLDEIIQKYVKPIPSNVVGEYVINSDYFDRLVYTDVHIAMNVNGKDGDSLYEGKWDREEVLKRLDLMLYHIHTFKKGRKLIIDDLGDFLDGLGGQTTRKGHELPQNMNDKDAFELALEFKIKLIDNLVNLYDEIVCHNITNDNHSGVFSYFVSSAFEKIISCRYNGKVKVKTVKKFIDHYSEGKHTFLISHGKDMGEQKFGLKPKLDANQAEKIDQYCKEHKLYNGNFIEFSKGDSHQAIYDDTTSNDFSYYNYPAFSPPSNWVKTNFKNSKSGFNFFNIKKDENIKISIPYWF